MADIYQMLDEDGQPILVTQVAPGMTRESLAAMWERLEEVSRNGYEVCSVCGKAVPKDERGAALDSSERCDECRP